MDYRELNEKFDRIVSVGMFEHVGRKFYKKFFNQIEKLLNDDGISLIHTIGSVNPPSDPHPWITKHIFRRLHRAWWSFCTHRKSWFGCDRYWGFKITLFTYIKTLERELWKIKIKLFKCLMKNFLECGNFI